MTPKALFLDIDGTLVSFRTHSVPESARQAISQARKQGVKVFIATGRPLPFVAKRTAEGISLGKTLAGLEFDGIMCDNGAYCITSDGIEISKRTVSRSDLERLIAYQREHPMPIIFANTDGAMLCGEQSGWTSLNAVFTLLDIPLPTPKPIEEALKMEVVQVIAFFTPHDEPQMLAEVLKGCDANRWHESFADCTQKGINKATGIDDVARYYGFDISETVAIGDGGNDITMLYHAGVGVAMGNANDEVKAHADMVTTSVDEDGLANALKELKIIP